MGNTDSKSGADIDIDNSRCLSENLHGLQFRTTERSSGDDDNNRIETERSVSLESLNGLQFSTPLGKRKGTSNSLEQQIENIESYPCYNKMSGDDGDNGMEAERSGSLENVDGLQFSTPLTERNKKGSSKLLEQQIENKDSSSIIPRKTPQSPEPLPQDNNRVFQGVFVNQVLLCRDEYISKYTKEQVYKWRKAKIIAIEGADNSRVQVHFIRWAVSFDKWLDLNKEWFKLAPVRLLSKDECKAGNHLNDWQQDVVIQFLLQIPSIHAMEEESTSPPSASAPLSGEDSTSSPFSSPALVKR